ncbi:MAG: hypothetical protein HY254_24595 [Burkholderiales bacterium]|nr:hypothetical protein [Burkholderiales bacterium]
MFIRILHIINNPYGVTMMKHWKILIAAPLVAFAVNYSFAGAVKTGIPKGWVGNGAIATHYESGLDESQGTKEQPAFFIAAKDTAADDFAAITQVVDASAYRGKVMMFTASALHVGDLGGYEFWIRTTDEKGNTSIASSWARKSSDWEAVRVRLSVNANAQKIELGVGVRDKGKLFIKGLSFTEAQTSNPIPESKPIANKISMGSATTTMQNLNFSE